MERGAEWERAAVRERWEEGERRRGRSFSVGPIAAAAGLWICWRALTE
ncbi:hypothetical protein [Halosimplex amylolyticum]